MPALHAKLSPSGAKLDLYCPGNRREQAKFPRSSSESSAKGTGAHKMGEVCLNKSTNTLEYVNHWVGEMSDGNDFLLDPTYPVGAFAADTWKFKVDAKMAADVQMYVDEVRKVGGALPGSIMGVEIKSKVTEDIWGTSDAVIAQYFGRLHILDYKNGVTYVDVFENPQLMLYAIGQILFYRSMGIEFRDVMMTIVQPNTREGKPIRNFGPVSPDDLINWYNKTYIPAAAECLDPNAPMTPGKWCKELWCDARHQCPALAGLINETAQGMFSPVVAERPRSLPAPIQMTPDQRNLVLENKDLVTDWLAKVYEYEYSQHKKGLGAWGKLVKGQNSRSWADPNTIEASLNIMLNGDINSPGKLKSPAMVENTLKALGFNAAQVKAKLNGLIKTSSGRPKLVSTDSPGKTVNLADSMFANQ